MSLHAAVARLTKPPAPPPPAAACAATARSRKLLEQRGRERAQPRPAPAPAPERVAPEAAAGPLGDVQAARLATELHETKQRLASADAAGGELRRERDDLAARLGAAEARGREAEERRRAAEAEARGAAERGAQAAQAQASAAAQSDLEQFKRLHGSDLEAAHNRHARGSTYPPHIARLRPLQLARAKRASSTPRSRPRREMPELIKQALATAPICF